MKTFLGHVRQEIYVGPTSVIWKASSRLGRKTGEIEVPALKFYKQVRMSLRYKYKLAQKIISRQRPADSKGLERICMEIRKAEDDLLTAYRDIIKKCIYGCEGICCRNIHIDDIITQWDFVLILTLHNEMSDRISKCIANENLLFASDCVFLENGKGPCIFPDNSRPQVCLTTFCGDEEPIRKEIFHVNSKFYKLQWFALTARLRACICFPGVFSGANKGKYKASRKL